MTTNKKSRMKSREIRNTSISTRGTRSELTARSCKHTKRARTCFESKRQTTSSIIFRRNPQKRTDSPTGHLSRSTKSERIVSQMLAPYYPTVEVELETPRIPPATSLWQTRVNRRPASKLCYRCPLLTTKLKRRVIAPSAMEEAPSSSAMSLNFLYRIRSTLYCLNS